MEIAERTIQVAGLDVLVRQAGDASILYLHGVPTHSCEWVPFLERFGGIAPDLPGFGRSAKPAGFDYSIAGYDAFLEELAPELGLDRLTLVMHDWGAVGLAFAQRFPERIERLAMFSLVPFVPGYRWHRVARAWRTPVVGELLMGFSTRWAFRRELPRELADSAWETFDHGTQRAILKLYRASPPEVLARAGERLGDIRAPALILWADDDPYLPAEFGRRTADALGGEVTLELVQGGHWTWHVRPELVDRVAEFLGS
ncbi:MAG TPA: alpha/beta fold hydrolase [Thermoleophilaceae bacterium]|nr:alpha/beta fold hydrolase [Thermoleophilaceae bacterium]